MIWGKIISFTSRGAAVGRKLAALMPQDKIERYARGEDASLEHTIFTRMIQQAMVDCGLIVFIGDAETAVRAIAPYLQGAPCDPAVLVVDENETYIFPLLNGYLDDTPGLVQRLADGLGAQPVFTTEGR